MATKLDQTIAEVARAYGRVSRHELVDAAKTALVRMSDKDFAKLPDRADYKMTAKAAGVPDLEDAWHRLWFEAVVELLLQSGERGVPGLVNLWERDAFTHPEFVLPALIRMALAGHSEEEIDLRIRSRFETLNYPFVRMGMMEAFNWSSVTPGIRDYLKRFESIRIRSGDGETVGTLLHRFTHIEPL